MIGSEAICIITTQLEITDLIMKKLQNNLIAIDRQLVENNRPEHELLSSMPDITNVKVSLIVTDITSVSVILILTNITITSRNSYINIILNIVLNIINIDYIDINSTITEISGLVATSAQDEITLIVLSIYNQLEMNTTLRLSQSSLILEDIKKNYKNNLFCAKII